MTYAPEREDIKCPIAGGAPDCIKKTQIRNLRQEFLNSLSFLLSMLFRFLIVDVMCVMSVAPAPVGPGKSPTLTASAKS